MKNQNMNVVKHVEVSDISNELLSEKLVDNGNPNSVSDAGVAAEVALAGVRGAGMNVMINLSGLEDSSYVEDVLNKINKLINDAQVLHKAIYNKTLLIIKS